MLLLQNSLTGEILEHILSKASLNNKKCKKK